MPLSPITPSLPPANPLANPNTPLPAQNTAAESSEPSHNLPLHLRRFGVTEGTVAYLEDGNTVKRILLQKDTTSPIFTLPSTFKPGQYIETRVDKQTSRHPLTFYTNIPPNNLSLAVQDRYMSMRNPSQSEQHTTSSLRGLSHFLLNRYPV